VNARRRTLGILVICCLCDFILGCNTPPTVTPDVADTATDLTSTADDVSDTIDAATDEAQDIATAATGTDLEKPTAKHVETMKRLQAERDELNKAVEKSNALSFRLAGEIEKLMEKLAKTEKELAVIKQQRITLIIALGFLVVLILIYLYARIKRLV